jgi:hypothetical protein
MPGEIITAFGDAAKAIVRRLRRVDSVFFFRAGAFTVILPQTSSWDATRITDQVSDGLLDASGSSSRYTFEANAFNYPEDVSSASEMERRVRTSVERPLRGFGPLEEALPFDEVLVEA